MFDPKYTISNKLLSTITAIHKLVFELNSRRFPSTVLFEYERSARALSVHTSTHIEGNPLSLTEVKKVLKQTPKNILNSQREVLNYNIALLSLNRSLEKTQPLTKKRVFDIHAVVIDGLLPKYQIGKVRNHPVVLRDPKTGELVFMPPNHDDVDSLLTDLLSFAKKQSSQIDPVILAGLFHKQMVIIHPFMDGNGRTTRLLTKVLLAKLGINTFNLFSFENYYNNDITRYFSLVGEFGDYYELQENIDFSDWLEYFAEGILDELERVTDILPAYATSPDSKLSDYHNSMVEYITDHGFITDKEYSQLVDRAKATRALDFKKMRELDIIDRKGAGKGTYYVLSEL